MVSCSSGKKVYLSQTIAEDVLIELWTRFEYAPNQGPIAVYQCDDCGYFHLTSTGKMNEKLAMELGSGKIQRSKEGNEWIEKLKKR